MSVDTNLHRTFDYQLCPAPLRIIDWAPVKSVAAAVLQDGPAARGYTAVDSSSANEAVTAAAYARQESVLRELARHRAVSASSTIPHDGTAASTENGLTDTAAAAAAAAATSTAAPSQPAASAGAMSSFAVGQSDASAIAAASPYYTPGAAVNTPGQLVEVYADDALPSPQQRVYSESWSGNGNDYVTTSPNVAGGTTPSPAAAVGPSNALTIVTGEGNNNNGAPAPSNSMSGAAALNGAAPISTGAANASHNNGSGHSGTATPKAGAAPHVSRTPSPSSCAPRLARYSRQWNAAGNMYGFDSVYHNGTFGVLLGLFTGAGYQQTNVFYRQEEQIGSDGAQHNAATSPSASLAAATTTATAAAATGTTGTALGSGAINGASVGGASAPLASGTSPTAAATSAPGSASNSATHRSLSETNNGTSPAGVNAFGAVANGSGLGNTDGNAGPDDGDAAPRTRRGPVVAYKNKGGFQLSNSLQCFWYWGAKRWAGVLNFRFLPLLSGDAIMPVCECVTRTEITENSLLIDDPVVYMHSFVVMLGRRKRVADEALSGAAEQETAEPDASSAGRHPIVASAMKSATAEGSEDSAPSRKTSASPGAAHRTTPQRGALERNSVASTSAASSDPGTTPQHPASVANTQKESARGASSSRGPQAQRLDNSKVRDAAGPSPKDSARTHNAAAVPAPSSSTEESKPVPEWFYWYQRCMLDTSDEWLWNRAAAEVAAEAAQATTPWWKLQHVKTGVGLSYRYRKPRGINVYWGWSAQLGRGTSLSGHVDVLRRMSCSISSSFGYLDLSVRLRVNLVTLHQTALDAGLCWRPLPHVPEFAVRLATSANGTTLGVEMADIAPTLYSPLVERLAQYRARKHLGEAAVGESATASSELAKEGSNGRHSSSAAVEPSPPLSASSNAASGGGPDAHTSSGDTNKEDLVGLLPVTWHYLQGFGSTITHVYSGVAGAVASTWRSSTTPAVENASKETTEVLRAPAPLPVSAPAFATVPPTPSLAPDTTLSGMVVPLGRAGVQYFRRTCRYVADLGWLETMLRTSHVNVSMGVTAEPGKLARDWSFFLILSEK